MSWNKEIIIQSIVRKPEHRPKFDLGRRVFNEIQLSIEQGKKVRVDDAAFKLAREWGQSLTSEETPIVHHPRNRASPEKLGEKRVLRIIDGVDFLLAFRKGKLEELGKLDVVVYIRNKECPYDPDRGGRLNEIVLVSEVKNLKPFFVCPKKAEKHCGAIGRSGFLLETE